MIYILNSAFHFSAQHSLEILTRTMLCFQRYVQSTALVRQLLCIVDFQMPLGYVCVTKCVCACQLVQGQWKEIGKSASILQYYLTLISVGHQDVNDNVIESFAVRVFGEVFWSIRQNNLFESELPKYWFAV